MALDDSMQSPYPVLHCPACGEPQVDYDGLGVINCEVCGWCTHASCSTHGGRMVCNICGEVTE